jgi:peptidoglycan L-alanyl-D-glutamate endopeptidase CwlK
MDSVSEGRLAEVCPALSSKIHLLADILTSAGTALRITQGLRTWAEQDALYQQGRTMPGAIVTNAPPGYSWHQFGLAADVVPMDPLPDWNVTHPVWAKIISSGEAVGLYSGDEFHTFKDEPHFQLTGVFPASPNDEVRQILLNDGLEAVWEQAGLSLVS